MTTQEVTDAGLGPKLPGRAELLALGGINARMQVIIGGPKHSPMSGTEEVWAEWDGRRLLARSRYGASFALCRLLVAAGCPDQALQVYRHSDGQHQYTFKSIHKAATRTIKENGRQPAFETTFTEYPSALRGRELAPGKSVERQVPSIPYREPSRKKVAHRPIKFGTDLTKERRERDRLIQARMETTNAGTTPETAARNAAEDQRAVATLEHLWTLHRQGDDAGLADALSKSPTLIRQRFEKDRAAGRVGP